MTVISRNGVYAYSLWEFCYPKLSASLNPYSVADYAVTYSHRERLQAKNMTEETYQKTTSWLRRVVTDAWARFSDIYQLNDELFNYDQKRLILNAKNTDRYLNYFRTLNEELKASTKPICVFALTEADADHNGAFYRTDIFYQNHQRIEQLKKIFSVYGTIINNSSQLFNDLKNLREQFPNREIKILIVNGHGSPDGILFNNSAFSSPSNLNHRVVEHNKLDVLAADATIVLVACSTAELRQNQICFADKLAKENPGKTVYGVDRPAALATIEAEGSKITNVWHWLPSQHMITGTSALASIPTKIPAKKFYYKPSLETEGKAPQTLLHKFWFYTASVCSACFNIIGKIVHVILRLITGNK